jgi:hypothetical protein
MTYKNRPRIIHYTESLGGGVLRAIEILSKAQIESGYEVSLAYLRREITPTNQQLAINLESVQLIELQKTSAFGMLRMFSHATFWMLQNRKGVVHAHSSWAGAAVRLASIMQFKSRVFYTPHGFSFLRQDISKIEKWGSQFLNPVTLVEVITKNVLANWKAIAADSTAIETDFNAGEYEKVGEDLGDLVVLSLGKITHVNKEADIDWDLLSTHLTLF